MQIRVLNLLLPYSKHTYGWFAAINAHGCGNFLHPITRYMLYHKINIYIERERDQVQFWCGQIGCIQLAISDTYICSIYLNFWPLARIMWAHPIWSHLIDLGKQSRLIINNHTCNFNKFWNWISIHCRLIDLQVCSENLKRNSKNNYRVSSIHVLLFLFYIYILSFQIILARSKSCSDCWFNWVRIKLNFGREEN